MKPVTASHPASNGTGRRVFDSLALALCLLSCPPSVHGQTFGHAWTVIKQTTGIAAPEQFYRTTRDASGNVIIIGTVDDGSGTGGQMLVQKRSAATGALLWERKLGCAVWIYLESCVAPALLPLWTLPTRNLGRLCATPTPPVPNMYWL